MKDFYLIMLLSALICLIMFLTKGNDEYLLFAGFYAFIGFFIKILFLTGE